MISQTPTLSINRSPLNRFFGVITCLGIGLLTACANVIPPCGAKISPPSSELRNTKWELTRWNLPPNANGEVRTRQIPQGDEDSRGFSLSKIASTKMTCSLQRMELENDFLYELNDYRSIVRNGDQLLMIGTDREVLSFSQRSVGVK